MHEEEKELTIVVSNRKPRQICSQVTDIRAWVERASEGTFVNGANDHPGERWIAPFGLPNHRLDGELSERQWRERERG